MTCVLIKRGHLGTDIQRGQMIERHREYEDYPLQGEERGLEELLPSQRSETPTLPTTTVRQAIPAV